MQLFEQAFGLCSLFGAGLTAMVAACAPFSSPRAQPIDERKRAGILKGTPSRIGNGYAYGDRREPSAQPPGGLRPDQVPMFVTIGFDDNAYSGLPGSGGTGGMSWALEMLKARRNPSGVRNAACYDGEPVRATFFMTSANISATQSEHPAFVRRMWREAVQAGHEIGNHTHHHRHGAEFDASAWAKEMDSCNEWLFKAYGEGDRAGKPNAGFGLGLDQRSLHGFRAPFLEYSNGTFEAAKQQGFQYDCSIEEGFQPDQDGRNYFWPYTLDEGSPGNALMVTWGLKTKVEAHAGLWELPAYAVVVPPDSHCERYGVQPGLRERLKERQSYFDVSSGKITGFDYNLWVSFKMTKAEVLATLKYSLDLRLEGNRAPFMFGGHSDIYASKYAEGKDEGAMSSTLSDRQGALEEFIDYALSKPDVRVTTMKKILDWLRQPVALKEERRSAKSSVPAPRARVALR